MTISKNGKEYLSFMEKIDLLENVQTIIEDEDMKSRLDLWLKEMNNLGHIGYPMDKFRGVEDL
jgi:hypothetical protein